LHISLLYEKNSFSYFASFASIGIYSGIQLISFSKARSRLFQFFIGNIVAMNWSGQFNVDFICYLMLSGFWIMWRSKFSIGSVILGFAAMILGILFFSPYLMYLLNKSNGNLKLLFLGEHIK
jgi:hypothetical protein